MIVQYDPDYYGQGPEIYLQAQSDRDHKLLDRIKTECVTRGCGRVGDPVQMHHVRIALAPFKTERTDDMGDV